MKIGFFLNNEELEGLNWETVSIANPGAGGTEYVIVLESYMMSLEKDVEFVLYAVKSSIFPKSITVKYVSTSLIQGKFIPSKDISFSGKNVS